MTNAAWLDTYLFAPRPLQEIERDAIASRPDMRIVETANAHVRVRAQIEKGKPTVILLPDAPNTIEHYDPIFEGLRGEFSVVAIEIPGFGFSYALNPSALTFDGAVQAIVAVIKLLQLDSLILTGPCVQAYMAIAVAAALPDISLGVIAAQATDLAGEKKWINVVDRMGFLREPVVGQLAWARPQNREQRSVDGWYHAVAGPDIDIAPWKETARWAIHCGCSFALATVVQAWLSDEAFIVPKWEGPAVILFGQADKTHTACGSDANGLKAYLPRAEVRELPRSGHFPDLEDVPAFTHAIRQIAAS